MPRDRNIPQNDPADQPLLENLARMIGELLERRLGPNATFEDRQRARMEVMADVMWLGEEHDLVDLVEDAPMITIGGRPFRRLSQPSSKIYSGVWGAHRIDEPLYRDASVHAGETVKPLDLRVGAIATSLLPDAARILGYLMAHGTSREVVETLATMGMRPPSRALIERRVHELADEVVDRIDELDAVARDVEAAAPLPLAAVSVGLDRFSVRMSEALPEGSERPPSDRAKPYQRRPPAPRVLNWRMAWVGSVTLYDADGEARRIIRHGADAATPREHVIDRVAAEVEVLLEHRLGRPRRGRRSRGGSRGTCALMQTRVKRPGMAWEPPGLRGLLCLRGLVLAKRWEAVWPSFSANSRVSVEAA